MNKKFFSSRQVNPYHGSSCPPSSRYAGRSGYPGSPVAAEPAQVTMTETVTPVARVPALYVPPEYRPTVFFHISPSGSVRIHAVSAFYQFRCIIEFLQVPPFQIYFIEFFGCMGILFRGWWNHRPSHRVTESVHSGTCRLMDPDPSHTGQSFQKKS